MNKVILSANPARIRRFRTDVAIVGCGVAGLYAALSLDQRLSCTILHKA